MAKTNEQTNVSPADVIARMAINGASHEQMVATAAALGYVLPGGNGKAAATAAPHSTPAWAQEAKAAMPPDPGKAGAGKVERTITPRAWAGPFDAGNSNAGHPQVAFTSKTITGQTFRVSFPLDLLLQIQAEAKTAPAK